MKYTFVIALCLLASACNTDNKPDKYVIELGGSPPGKEAVIFSPDLVSADSTYEFASTFGPSGKEFYYTRLVPGGSNEIYMTLYSGGEWTRPVKASFADSPFEFEPHITPDGQTIFWGSSRVIPGDSLPPSYPRIWYAMREGEQWGSPRLLDQEYMMYVYADRQNNLYYTHNGFFLLGPDEWEYSKPVIAKSSFTEGAISSPEINMSTDTALYPGAHPCIAPDGSFIIFDSPQREDTYGNTDLYISFRLDDNSWSEAINMGEMINTKDEDMCASLSPCGKYLIFSRFADDRSDLYWISSEIIDDLRPGL